MYLFIKNYLVLGIGQLKSRNENKVEIRPKSFIAWVMEQWRGAAPFEVSGFVKIRKIRDSPIRQASENRK